MRVAIIDDDDAVQQILRPFFEREGFSVITASDGTAGLELVRREPVDIIILDLMMPGMGGCEVCRLLRRETDVPIIMLTALGYEDDRLKGLEIGADDYVAKPFSAREVVARAKAVLRRTRREVMGNEPMRVGRMLLDNAECRVTVDDRSVVVTPAEFRILKRLALNLGRTLSREQLMGEAADETVEGYDRKVDAHIKNLRRKMIEAGLGEDMIQTLHGVGYRMAQE